MHFAFICMISFTQSTTNVLQIFRFHIYSLCRRPIWSPVSIQTQSLALRALRALNKRKPQETQALAFLAVFVYATHATQAIAFEWKPGLSRVLLLSSYNDEFVDLLSCCFCSIYGFWCIIVCHAAEPTAVAARFAIYTLNYSCYYNDLCLSACLSVSFGLSPRAGPTTASSHVQMTTLSLCSVPSNTTHITCTHTCNIVTLIANGSRLYYCTDYRSTEYH